MMSRGSVTAPAAETAASPAASAAPPEGLVAVLWWDAAFELDAVPGLAMVCTPGWIVKEDARSLVVASENIDHGKSHRAYTEIPAGDVIAIVPVAVVVAA